MDISIEPLVYLYFILAVGYNLASIVCKDLKGRSLAPTDAVNAITMLTVVFLLYSDVAAIDQLARTLLMMVFIALILRFGIFEHSKSYSTEGYLSRFSWSTAIGINLFGVSVLSLSLINI